MTRNKMRWLVQSACFGVAALLPATAMASAQEASASANEEQAANSLDIIVTAQRREQSLQDVPVAVSALSGDSLKDMNVQSVSDLASKLPNFSLRDPGPVPQFNIRGTSLNDFGDGNESPVAVYVDEVYKATLAGQTAQLFDIQRVEVLRGPQGTLFGRNASGGLVQFITRSPTRQFEANASAQVGSYAQRILEGSINVPLGTSVAFRLSGIYNEDDGRQQNAALAGDQDFAKTNVVALRGKLKADLSPTFSALATVNWSRERSNYQGYGTVGGVDPTTGNNCAPDRIWSNTCVDGRGLTVPTSSPDTIYYRDPRLRKDADLFGASLKLSLQLGEQTELVSLTAYDKTERYLEEGTDGTANGQTLKNDARRRATVFPADYYVNARQFSQELRLSGKSDVLSWIVGAYYFHDRKDPVQTVDRFSRLPPNAPFPPVTTTTDLTTESYAVFGQADYKLSPTVTVSLGARYSHDTKDLTITDDSIAPQQPLSRSVTAGRVTGRAAIEFRPSDGKLFYVSASTGFKSPEFNVNLLTFPYAQLGPVGGETSTSYEAGAKFEAPDRSWTLNAAAYYARTSNKQARVASTTASGSVATLFLNAGIVNAYGVELEAVARPTNGLELRLSGSWNDAKLDAPSTLTLARTWDGISLPIDGSRVPGTPELLGQASIRYAFDLGGGEANLQVSGRAQSKVQWALANNPWEVEAAYGIVDLGVGWRSASSKFGIQAFANNVFNKQYANLRFWINRADQPVVVWGMPRMFGVRLNVKFD